MVACLCRHTAPLVKHETALESEWDFSGTRQKLKQINAFKLMMKKTPVTTGAVDVHESI